VSYLVSDALDRLRPRLILDPRTPRRFRATLAGLLTGILGVVLGAAAIMVLEPWVHEGVLLSTGASIAPLPIHLLLARRRKRDTCLACGYDLSATSRRCPECGSLGSRA